MNKRTHASTSFRRFLSLAVFLITFLLLPAETFGQASATRKKPTAARTAQTRRTSQPYKRPANAAQKSNPQANSVNSLIRKLLNDMVHVKGGTFVMGVGATSKHSDENPAHNVTLRDFYLCKYEVTQALWTAVMGSNPAEFKSPYGKNYPVEKVSYDDCQNFIRKLNAMTGKRFRLPTEAEWEYAACGGALSKGIQYSGDSDIWNCAWYSANSSSWPHNVGTQSPNELGLYDMFGNVIEWCSDWYGEYGSSAQTNPQGPSSGSERVCRGGGWMSPVDRCRPSDRWSCKPDEHHSDLGLRLAASKL